MSPKLLRRSVSAVPWWGLRYVHFKCLQGEHNRVTRVTAVGWAGLVQYVDSQTQGRETFDGAWTVKIKQTGFWLRFGVTWIAESMCVMIWGNGWKSLWTTALDAFKTFVLPRSNWLRMQCLSACLVLLTPYRRTDAAGSSPKLSKLADPDGTTGGSIWS